MKRIILAGISASLLASMALTACDGKQATLKGENSVPISSATITSENTSSDIALTSSQAASSVAVSSKKAVSSKRAASSKAVSSKVASQYVAPLENLGALSEAQANRIRADWVSGYKNPGPENTADKVKITCYGIYNESVAIMLHDNFYMYPAIVWDDEIAGITFHSLHDSSIQIWNSGIFFSLRSAYEKGLLTQPDLKDIEYNYRTNK